MNPSWIKTQSDRQKVYKEYMASLRQETANINKTANALKTMELTGAPPVQVQDTRTTTEKYMDTYRLRNELESELRDIMSPDEAQKVVNELGEEEVMFARTQIEAIKKDLKPRFALGVPAPIFVNYLRKLVEKFVITEGVENASQSGYVSGSLFSAFAEIKATRDALQRLQQEVAQAQAQVPDLAGQPSEVSNALVLLPSEEELRVLARTNIENRMLAYQVLTGVERGLPDIALINTMIRDLVDTRNRGNIQELTRKLLEIKRQLQITEGQKRELLQLRDIVESEAPSGTEERAVVSSLQEQMRARKERMRMAREGQAGGAREEPAPSTQEETLITASEEESPIKVRRNDNKNLTEKQQEEVFGITYPLGREEFMSLNPKMRILYIARALAEGDIPEGQFVPSREVIESPQTGELINLRTSLTPRAILTNVPASSKIDKADRGRGKISAETALQIYDKYGLDQPVEEVFSPARRGEASSSLVTGESPAGVGSLFVRTTKPKGKGIRGRGLSNRVEGRLQGTPEPKSVYSFAPFGRYVINTNKLQKNVLTINTKTGKSIPRLKSKLISKDLANIFKMILRGQTPDNEVTMKLDKAEADLLYHSLNEAHLLGKHNITTDTLSKTEQELHRFNVLRGQILAGQNNEKVLREFKSLLLKYVNSQQIPRAEAYEILQEMLVLGY